MSNVGSTNISFSDLQSAYNNSQTNNPMDNPISMSEFRDIEFTDGTSVPGSGAISIDDHFKSKTFKSPDSGGGDSYITYVSSSYFNYSGTGTSSDPFTGQSTNQGRHYSTAVINFTSPAVSGYVYINITVSSETNYDFGIVNFGGIQYFRQSGAVSSNLQLTATGSSQTIQIQYYKDGSVNSRNDRVNFSMYWEEKDLSGGGGGGGFTELSKSYFIYSGSGTSSAPYVGYSTNNGLHNTTASVAFNKTSSSTSVRIDVSVSSEYNYDYGRLYINGSRLWNTSGSGSYTYNGYGALAIQIQYYKDGSVNNGSDRVNFTMYEY
tara:strand:+ start:1615 stop:2577 length:963 start_codon:yes stop_codon:yes gene_type:complete